MQRAFLAPGLVLATWLAIACQSAPAAMNSSPVGSAAAQAEPRVLHVGDRAPDFTLQDQNRQEVSLSQFRGRPVQIAFYVWAFSPG
ncbi:MAG: redoxin domain-containing protein [Chloroflexi bacterium]|nr:redoxin domain-containing protein [Chloroflexota bacterium]